MNSIEVKIKLGFLGVMPEYATDGSGAMDIVGTGFDIKQEYIEYSTDLFIEIPKGYVGLLFPRSSISNKQLVMSNSVGVIDSDYRGEIKVRFRLINLASVFNRYGIGDKIAQLMIVPMPNVVLTQVDELSFTERGAGGFGSTGV